MDKKELYKKQMYQEYKYMYRALCRMTSYYEKLTTDGYELTNEDKDFINTIIDKAESHFVKRIIKWIKKSRLIK